MLFVPTLMLTVVFLSVAALVGMNSRLASAGTVSCKVAFGIEIEKVASWSA